jgi:hypothetical protein
LPLELLSGSPKVVIPPARKAWTGPEG